MRHRQVILPILFLLVNISYSQEGLSKRAQKTYDNLSYVKTTEQLLEKAESGSHSPELLERLANSYYYNGKMVEAVRWYDELIEIKDAEIDPETYFRYSQALKGIGDYKKADTMQKTFMSLKPEDSRSKLYTSDYLKVIDKRSDDFSMNNLGVNTPYSDFGTSVHQGALIFASSRGGSKELYTWNEQPYLDVYTLDRDGHSQPIPGKVNTRYHESSTAFTKDGNTMYFTRNNYYKGEFKKNSKRIHGLKIYKAERVDGKWVNIAPVSFNSDEYNVAHPALSSDETQLYFSSDMEGTLGSSDLYVVDINEDGSFGVPRNLGEKINTEGRENFPYISESGTLYFSSDGHPGLGGLDVFEVKNIANLNSANTKVHNVGRPINSSRDDFEYMINETSLEGYLSSNREGGKGDDDIYSFTRNPYYQYITAAVVDKTTTKPISGATVEVYNSKNEVVKQLTSDASGEVSFKLSGKDQQFLARGNKANYLEGERSFMLSKDVLESNIIIELPPNEIDLFKLLNLKPIYFDYDKWDIRADAKLELAKIIKYMQDFPETRVDVRSHTDTRGSKSYNQRLSQKRNQSTIDYLVKEGGIEAGRLTGDGYGESQLINTCSDGIKCSEEEHQSNRRSEFILISD